MIVNPLRGEASVDIDGEPLALALDNGAFIAMEELTGRAFLDVVAELFASETSGRPPKLGTMQALLWAATRSTHSDLSATACGDLYLTHNRDITPALMEALIGALPKKEAAREGEAKATTKPQSTPKKRAQAGTGTPN